MPGSQPAQRQTGKGGLFMDQEQKYLRNGKVVDEYKLYILLVYNYIFII